MVVPAFMCSRGGRTASSRELHGCSMMNGMSGHSQLRQRVRSELDGDRRCP